MGWIINNPAFESDTIIKDNKLSPWSGHRSFAYDLISFLRPSLIVELGTQYGCSMFAFCQSIKDFGLHTKIIAVDTWQGDEHAGFYDESVFEIVSMTINTHFRSLDIELKRTRFIDAVDTILNESIDVLHIDGLHTYEAVSEDFTTWIPKLKKNGIVLFHDIFTEFGTNKFWKEIKGNKEYSYFEFMHNFGLGVLFPKGNRNYLKMVEENMLDKIEIYQYKALISSYKISSSKLLLDCYREIADQKKKITQLESIIFEKGVMS